jgi:DnaK suppressor protein
MTQTSSVQHRYSDEDLKEFRELILQKLEKTRGKLAFYLAQIQDLSQNDDIKVRSMDDGLGAAEMETAQNMAATERKYVHHLENALIRIDNKSYGVCRETGELIPKERLRVVPHATLCMSAKVKR